MMDSVIVIAIAASAFIATNLDNLVLLVGVSLASRRSPGEAEGALDRSAAGDRAMFKPMAITIIFGLAFDLRVPEADRRQDSWPEDGPSLAQQLRQLQPGLKAAAAHADADYVMAAIVGAVAASSTGFFLVHSVLAGYLNVRAGDRSASVSGLYVAIYYTGGTLGSYLPGFVYARFGWPAFVAVLAGMIAVGLVLTGAGMRAERLEAAQAPKV